ncbi:hypothetical protein AQUCO_08200040v1 [Aquilegia coerulea]|uniref:Protein kinase domain-containing protein n=1 Tax=Aquilegia coerulea TaxID=218851 RepID=A0A2G5C7I6_AQUCA|nr:hypothetical protein AQUCO_08200040v1 [Aquilegia coerulea]
MGDIEFNKLYYVNRVGRATYRKPIQIWDSSTGEVSDFTTHFSFTIDTLTAKSYGHGFAFFLAPISQSNLLVVEFDTFSNPDWDLPMEHIGINNNSIASSIHSTWNASLHSGKPISTWITYTASSTNLTVIWNFGAQTNLGNYTLAYQVDLKQVLPDWVSIDFSASTGTNVERHILHSWEFISSNLETNLPDISNQGKIKLVVSVLVPCVTFIVVVMISCYIVNMRKRQKTKETSHQTSFNFEAGVGPRRFSYKELAVATDNFSFKRKLGEGGFGGVYKGTIGNLALDVAVKRISRNFKQGKKEYITEVEITSQLRHRNLVQLLGWCHEKGEFLLVYNFMPHGSLDFHLFGNKSPLSWPIRYSIALGLASALLYLHEEREQCVVHRDIKPSNVMLDSDFNAKLGDFGLARLMDHDLGLKTTRLAGTIGYMAPEYLNTGKASKKSDVYSFGVVALEIACGKKSVHIIPVGLVQWVWTLYERGQLLKEADERLCMEYDAKQMECLMTVGLWCAHPDHNLRPSIKQAIQVLNLEAAVPTLHKICLF